MIVSVVSIVIDDVEVGVVSGLLLSFLEDWVVCRLVDTSVDEASLFFPPVLLLHAVKSKANDSTISFFFIISSYKITKHGRPSVQSIGSFDGVFQSACVDTQPE